MSDALARERKMKLAGMLDVTWRSASAFRAAATAVEFSFETACGAVLRFRMPKSSARLLHVSLGEALDGYAADQPPIVSGIPSRDGSPNDGHVPVPVAMASAQACGVE